MCNPFNPICDSNYIVKQGPSSAVVLEGSVWESTFCFLQHYADLHSEYLFLEKLKFIKLFLLFIS